jgi:hypothetical protein
VRNPFILLLLSLKGQGKYRKNISIKNKLPEESYEQG